MHTSENQLLSMAENHDGTSSDNSLSMMNSDENTIHYNSDPTYGGPLEDTFQVMQKSSALFMLGLKEQHKIPQAVATDSRGNYKFDSVKIKCTSLRGIATWFYTPCKHSYCT